MQLVWELWLHLNLEEISKKKKSLVFFLKSHRKDLISVKMDHHKSGKIYE